MNNNRPVNLDLMSIKFPVPAIASILHRITGVALFVAVPILLWMADRSMASPESFADMKQLMDSPLLKLVVWLILAVLSYHLVAGIRHLVADAGVGESLEGGRRGAKTVFVVTVILILLAGAWIW